MPSGNGCPPIRSPAGPGARGKRAGRPRENLLRALLAKKPHLDVPSADVAADPSSSVSNDGRTFVLTDDEVGARQRR
jgi:hypothetical protein